MPRTICHVTAAVVAHSVDEKALARDLKLRAAAIDFVVEADRAQLTEIVQRVRDGRLRANIGAISTLDDAVAAFNATERVQGKTIIRVRP